MELVLATKNPGKIREMRKMLDLPGLTVLTHRDFDEWPELEETGETLEENAVIKAETVRDHFGLIALADDSGLLVDALDGRPGVHSSRYAGPQGDAELNMDRLLAELDGVPSPERSARFSCVIAIALPAGELQVTRAECEGSILTVREGSRGFGYDPVFCPKGFDCSMAELSLEEKNSISHRGKALRAARILLESML
ncbi:MAG: XTP/dITP diphosphatase [Actinobacteria bacterium]|nr:XTP/dITP diphosphatase [Actinomycetota bacterium]MCG2794562.1 XTP/dITP diphosphatase [Actinomycetes bacterium]MBU4239892.1 XTP/dITP diphosphatase [Actinomycetota bacterium]MBU4301715.1 XTP/dITP diphosphatase [Actinomycetota bacterium]MBU4386637.1 XTP/dITP diphosphatase [Actinomycetota bacterium]